MSAMKIKRSIGLLLVIALSLSFLSSCSQQDDGGDQNEMVNQPAENKGSEASEEIPVYEFGDRFDRDFEGYGMAYIIVTDGGYSSLCDIMIDSPELYALYKKSGTIIPDERNSIKYEESNLRLQIGKTEPLNARDVCPYNIEYGEEEAQRMVDTMSVAELKQYVITKHYPTGKRIPPQKSSD